MTYIYIDESGNLGMSDHSSEYFVITAVKIDDEKTNIFYKRIPKQVRQRQLKKKTKKAGELKFSNSSTLIREQFLKKVAQLDVEVYAIIIRKEYTKEKLRNNLAVLYNYLIKILLEKVLVNIDKNKKLNIYLDKCMSPRQRDNFETYIKTEFLSILSYLPDICITHESSEGNEGLQVSDFVCSAIGFKYNTMQLNNGCDYYTKIISKNIKVERNDLFKPREA